MNLRTVVEALANQIQNATHETPRHVTSWQPAGIPAMPAVIVRPRDDEFMAYHGTMDNSSGGGGLADVVLRVQILVSLADPPSAHRLMYDLLSAGPDARDSIHRAISSDRTLGGVVQQVVAKQARWVGPVRLMVENAESQALAAEIDVNVYLAK